MGSSVRRRYSGAGSTAFVSRADENRKSSAREQSCTRTGFSWM